MYIGTMRRGTTPVHTFTLPKKYSDIEPAALYVTYNQHGTTVLEKTLSDVSYNDGVITVTLTQEDTLAFSDEDKVLMQVRIRTVDGDALASNIIKCEVKNILKDCVI